MRCINTPMILAGTLSFVASLLHVAIIIGGPQWYRFFGAGEQMAQLAEQGSHYPTIVTFFIASVLFIWGLYAFSAAEIINRLPFVKTVLTVVTAIYTLRGIGGLFLAFVPQMQQQQDFSFTFWIVSSVICLIYGIVHFIGLRQHWHLLKQES